MYVECILLIESAHKETGAYKQHCGHDMPLFVFFQILQSAECIHLLRLCTNGESLIATFSASANNCYVIFL